MANAVLYVDSGAVGTGTGASWVNAFTTLAAAITASGTTGTDFYIKSTHTESGAGLTFTFKGVLATPDRVFSSGVTNSPPTSGDLTFGAAFSTTLGNSITLVGFVYIYGCQFTPGAGANGANFVLHNASAGDITLDSCKYIQGGTSASAITSGAFNNLSARTTFINTTVKFGTATSGIYATGGIFRWFDTTSAIDGTGTLPTTLFMTNSNKRASLYVISGVDLSAMTSKAITGALVCYDQFSFYNCKLPTGFTVGTPAASGITVDFANCDSGSTSYKQQRNTYQGTLTADTGVFNNATDGVTPISWKVIATANANPQAPFECPENVQWAPAGTYAASTIMLTSATAALKTNDVWVDVEYMGSNFPQAGYATTLGAGSGSATLPQIPQGTTPGNIAAGSWATGGLGNNYSLAIPSFTTSAAGYVRFRVKVGKASLTLNIDPAATIA